MRKITIILVFSIVSLFAFSVSGFAQMRGTFGNDAYYLKGEMSIHLKNKEIISGEFDIDNTKFKGSDINYQDVDFIVMDNARYEYVKTGKDKIRLLKTFFVFTPLDERGKVMFYESVPKMVPKADAKWGVYEINTKVSRFMLKEGMDVAVKYQSWKAGDLVKKYFSDCPVLMEMHKDKKEREKITDAVIYMIYNAGCIKQY